MDTCWGVFRAAGLCSWWGSFWANNLPCLCPEPSAEGVYSGFIWTDLLLVHFVRFRRRPGIFHPFLSVTGC